MLSGAWHVASWVKVPLLLGHPDLWRETHLYRLRGPGRPDRASGLLEPPIPGLWPPCRPHLGLWKVRLLPHHWALGTGRSGCRWGRAPGQAAPGCGLVGFFHTAEQWSECPGNCKPALLGPGGTPLSARAQEWGALPCPLFPTTQRWSGSHSLSPRDSEKLTSPQDGGHLSSLPPGPSLQHWALHPDRRALTIRPTQLVSPWKTVPPTAVDPLGRSPGGAAPALVGAAEVALVAAEGGRDFQSQWSRATPTLQFSRRTPWAGMRVPHCVDRTRQRAASMETVSPKAELGPNRPAQSPARSRTRLHVPSVCPSEESPTGRASPGPDVCPLLGQALATAAGRNIEALCSVHRRPLCEH